MSQRQRRRVHSAEDNGGRRFSSSTDGAVPATFLVMRCGANASGEFVVSTEPRPALQDGSVQVDWVQQSLEIGQTTLPPVGAGKYPGKGHATAGQASLAEQVPQASTWQVALAPLTGGRASAVVVHARARAASASGRHAGELSESHLKKRAPRKGQPHRNIATANVIAFDKSAYLSGLGDKPLGRCCGCICC